MSEKNKIIKLVPPLSGKDVRELEVGDLVEISGRIVTARDRAYERILKLSREGEELPVDLEGGVVYHCGPLVKPTEDGWNILAAGPTTSARLDDMQAEFIEVTGVRALIGKGGVGEEVVPSLSSLGCVYLAFTGGAAALAAEAIKSVEKLVWKDLGKTEAIWVLKVRDFGPLTVAVDTKGGNLYKR